MRIAIITTGFAKDENDFTGASVFNNFVKELSSRDGVEVTVFALYYPRDRKEYNFYNAKVFSFGQEVKSKLHKPGIWKRCKRKFEQEHKGKKFDIIQAFWCGESGYTASILSAKLNIPLAATLCGGELAEIKSIRYGSQLKFWQRYFVKKTFEQASKIVAGSDYIIDKLVVYADGAFRKKSINIPFGVDQKLFTPPERQRRVSLPARQFDIINIANVLPVKSHIDLLKAFKIVLQKFPDTKLICCGNDEKSLLKKMVDDLNLNDNVEIKGFVDYRSLPEIINNSHLFVLSSLYESQNMALLEAAFCGLPVVSTDVGISGEITPYICEPGNHQQLAEKILFVLSDYVKIKKEAEVKVSLLHTKFSVSACEDEYIKLYKELIVLSS